MRKTALSVALAICLVAPLSAQSRGADLIEIPLRVENGRLMVTALDPDGSPHDFVLGLGMAVLTETGRARIGHALATLELGGVPVDLETASTVPDDYLEGADAVGILGGQTLNGHDILIDVPGGRLVLKPLGRAVRWDGVSLSSPVGLTVFHDVMLRADVSVGGKLAGGVIDLAKPGLEVNEPLRFAIEDGHIDSFRMGYAGWPALSVEVVDSPVLKRWDPENEGFVVLGASIAYECVLAISWYHAELRTCLR